MSFTKLNNRGYLLVNLVVGLGIIALILGISLPYIREYQVSSKLSAEAREMAGNLRQAQQLSITKQVVHGVEFDISDNAYLVKEYGNSTSTVKGVSLDSQVEIDEVKGLQDGRVKFNFYGGVDNAGEVILINANNNTSTVRIKPSGYVELK